MRDWRGLADETDKSRLEEFIYSNSPSTKVLTNEAETSLFKAVLLDKNHSFRCPIPKQHFNQYFPPPTIT